MERIHQLIKNYIAFIEWINVRMDNLRDYKYFNSNISDYSIKNDQLLELRSLVTRIAGFHGWITGITKEENKTWVISFASYTPKKRALILCPEVTMLIRIDSKLRVTAWRELSEGGRRTQGLTAEWTAASARCQEINMELIG